MFWLQLIKLLIMLLLCDDFIISNSLIQELGSKKTYKRISTDERSNVNTHSIDIAVSIKEKQDRLPTLYWLPKLHKRPYKARFIANSSLCTTTVWPRWLSWMRRQTGVQDVADSTPAEVAFFRGD